MKPSEQSEPKAVGRSFPSSLALRVPSHSHLLRGSAECIQKLLAGFRLQSYTTRLWWTWLVSPNGRGWRCFDATSKRLTAAVNYRTLQLPSYNKPLLIRRLSMLVRQIIEFESEELCAAQFERSVAVMPTKVRPLSLLLASFSNTSCRSYRHHICGHPCIEAKRTFCPFDCSFLSTCVN
jgi:hypothetical protein